MAAAFRRHPPHGLARTEKRTDRVDAEDALEAFGGHRLEPHLTLEDAGVVDERVRPPEPSVDLREQTLDVALGSDVGGDRNPASSRALDSRGHLARGRFVANVIDADVVAARRGKNGRRPPNPAARAGDDDDAGHLVVV